MCNSSVSGGVVDDVAVFVAVQEAAMVVTQMVAEIAKDPTTCVRMVVVAVAAMVYRVPPRPVCVAFQQPQFTDQLRVIG